MTAPRPRLPSRAGMEQQRDQALRDLLELEQQVSAGDVPPGPAVALRRRYERTAAEALAVLDGDDDGVAADGEPPRRVTWRAAVYGAGALAAVVALVVVLPPALQERPEGGFVSGNEVMQVDPEPGPSPSAPPGRDLSKVSDAEMERVVVANPDVIGMRLALAGRYRDQGEFDKAVPHYRQVLDRQPENAEALASLGWILLMLDDAGQAARFADEAVRSDPELSLAWWVQANVRLYGQDDPGGALEAVRRMQELPAEPEVRDQMAALEQEVQARLAAGGGG